MAVLCFVACSQLHLAHDQVSADHHLLKIKIADSQIIEEFENDPAVQRLATEIRSHGLTHVSNMGLGFLWVIATDDELEDLRLRKYDIEHVMQAPELVLHKRMVWGPSQTLPNGYHEYEEIVASLETLHRLNPRTTALHIIGRTQQFERPIYALELSDQASRQRDKPRVLFSAVIHGNEVMGAEVTMALLRDLLREHTGNESVARYLGELDIWFVPVINVDGYVLATTVNPSWRKNARDNDSDGKLSWDDGVDINRNFDFHFDTSGSSDPGSKFYRGESPFSERESRTMADLVRDQKFLFSFTYHSAESRVYYPWRITTDETEFHTPEDDLLTEMASSIADATRSINENYTFDAVRNTKTESYTTNYYYGALGTIDFIIELGKYDHVYPEPVLQRVIQNCMPGAHYLLDRALGPGLTGVVSEEGTGRPLLAEVKILPRDDLDADVMPRTTRSDTGRYYRALQAGTYSVVVQAAGMQTKEFRDVVVAANGWTELDCRLVVSHR